MTLRIIQIITILKSESSLNLWCCIMMLTWSDKKKYLILQLADYINYIN